MKYSLILANSDDILHPVTKLRRYLNKITCTNYEVIEDKIRGIKFDTEEHLTKMVNLFHSRSVDEPIFCHVYAKLCRILNTFKVKNGEETIEFRNLLLTRCQQEFEKNVYEGLDLEGREAAIAATEDIEKKKILQAELEEDKRRARRKSLGNMKLVGELYRLQMLKGFVVLNCVNKLCSDIEDETLECLCILLKTIGQQLETEMLEKKSSNLEYYFKKIRKIVADKSSNNVSSRVRFLLQDIIDMRENGWQERAIHKDNKPKTIDQIHEEVAVQEKQNLDDNYRRRRRRRNRRRKDGQHTQEGFIESPQGNQENDLNEAVVIKRVEFSPLFMCSSAARSYSREQKVIDKPNDEKSISAVEPFVQVIEDYESNLEP